MPRPLNLPLNRPSSSDNASSASVASPRALNTISESAPLPPAVAPVPPIPPKSTFRQSSSSLSLPHNLVASPLRQSEDQGTSIATSRTAPPAYEWVAESNHIDTESLDNGPVEGEKLAALRRNDGYKPPRRGGWWRVGLIAVACVAVIALVIGLAVGLTVGRKKHADSASSVASPSASDNSSTSEASPFPLGRYSIVTALQDVTTDCTSNPSTWTCYPYNTYEQSSTASQAVFNWAISNTSMHYATASTPSTSDQGVPSNLTISSASDVFTIAFTDRPLTYISSSSNSTAARYTFSFTMQKAVFPTTSITSDNTAAECFFNQTTFSGTLYLSAGRDYPGTIPVPNGPYTQWPYAVEVTQVSNGGSDTPACYEYVNGAIGNAVTSGLTPQSADAQCLCDYRNF